MCRLPDFLNQFAIHASTHFSDATNILDANSGGNIVLKIFALMLAAGLAIVVTSFVARATPSSPGTLAYQQSHVTLIGGGCIHGWYWNYRLKRCVKI